MGDVKGKPDPKTVAQGLSHSSEHILALQGAKGLAKRRKVSVRTLHRQLSSANTDIPTVKDTVRKERIVELLRSELKIKEVARMLGLSGGDSLARLIKRLFGKTPTELRRSVR